MEYLNKGFLMALKRIFRTIFMFVNILKFYNFKKMRKETLS